MQIYYALILKTVPEWNTKYKKLYTCTIGLSPQLGLIRLYPLPIVGANSGFIYHCEVEKRKIDSRQESYQLIGQMHQIRPFKKDKLNKILLDNFIVPSIDYLNGKRKSIGILKLDQFKLYWDQEKRFINTLQIGMFEDVQLAEFTNYTKESHHHSARIKFNDFDGIHDLQINDWGLYEYARKFSHDDQAFRFAKNATHLIVGNMLTHRNTWMGLKAYRI